MHGLKSAYEAKRRISLCSRMATSQERGGDIAVLAMCCKNVCFPKNMF